MALIFKVFLFSTTTIYAGGSALNNKESGNISGLEGTAIRSMARLTAGYSDNPDSFDPFVIYYDNRSTYNFDGPYDALKLFNTDASVTSFYVIGNDSAKMAINAIPFDGLTSTCNLKVGIKTSKDGIVVFRIKDLSGDYLSQPLFLKDNVTGITHNLTSGGDYSIYLQAGHYRERFSLSLGSITTDITETLSNEYLLKAFSARGVLNTEIALPDDKAVDITVCEISGKVISSQKIYSSGHYELAPLTRNGIYIVTLYSAKGKVSKKVFYRQ